MVPNLFLSDIVVIMERVLVHIYTSVCVYVSREYMYVYVS